MHEVGLLSDSLTPDKLACVGSYAMLRAIVPVEVECSLHSRAYDFKTAVNLMIENNDDEYDDMD